MKANVTWSTDEDSKIAGKACAKKAVLDLIQTKVAFVFSSVKYNQNDLLNGIKEVIGTAPIIGCTSNAGIMTQDGYITSNNGYVGMLALGDETTAIGTAGMPKLISEYETGKTVAKIAMEKVGTTDSPSYYYMIASSNAEEYSRGIQEIIGNVPCFGGNSADDDFSGKWTIYTEDSMFNDGVAVAFFYTNKTIKNMYSSKYHETINSGIITKVTDKMQLDKIGELQSLKQYCEWINQKNKDVEESKIFMKSVLNPLATKTENGETTVIKQPINANKDFSILLSNPVYTNQSIIQMQISENELVNSPAILTRELKQEIEKTTTPSAYILIQNAGRRIVSEKRIEEMYKKIKKETGEIPFIMPFTFGEYGRGKNTGNLYGNLMLSFIAFGK